LFLEEELRDCSQILTTETTQSLLNEMKEAAILCFSSKGEKD